MGWAAAGVVAAVAAVAAVAVGAAVLGTEEPVGWVEAAEQEAQAPAATAAAAVAEATARAELATGEDASARTTAVEAARVWGAPVAPVASAAAAEAPMARAAVETAAAVAAVEEAVVEAVAGAAWARPREVRGDGTEATARVAEERGTAVAVAEEAEVAVAVAVEAAEVQVRLVVAAPARATMRLRRLRRLARRSVRAALAVEASRWGVACMWSRVLRPGTRRIQHSWPRPIRTAPARGCSRRTSTTPRSLMSRRRRTARCNTARPASARWTAGGDGWLAATAGWAFLLSQSKHFAMFYERACVDLFDRSIHPSTHPFIHWLVGWLVGTFFGLLRTRFQNSNRSYLPRAFESSRQRSAPARADFCGTTRRARLPEGRITDETSPVLHRFVYSLAD